MIRSIYFDLDIDTVDSRWHPRLDSIADYLLKHPGYVLYVTAHGISTETNFSATTRSRAFNTITYLENKTGITDSRTVGISVIRSDDDAIENRKVELVVVKEAEDR